MDLLFHMHVGAPEMLGEGKHPVHVQLEACTP